MFRGLVGKVCRILKYFGPPALYHGSTRELFITPVSTIPKEVSFRSQLFVFSFVEAIDHAFLIALCIHTFVHLYSVSRFGY
jgi:hypothetical protein